MSTISSQESANVLRNFVKVGVSSIAYLRNLFAESVFEDTVIGGLQLKRLTRSIPESAALLDWIDHGVFDAMAREYLRQLVVSIHNSDHVALESYTFSLQYGGPADGEYSVQVSVGKGSLQNDSPKGGAPIGPSERPMQPAAATGSLVVSADKEHVKRQTVQVLRDLVLLAQSLSPLPDNRYLSMRLLYYDDRVPPDYEPQHFRSASYEEEFGVAPLSLDQQVGELATGHHNLAVDVRTCCHVDENVTNYKSSCRGFDTLTRRTSMSCAKPSGPPSLRKPAQDPAAYLQGPGASDMRIPPGSASRVNGVQAAAPRPPGGNRNIILGLLKRGHELALRTRYINKDCLGTGLGIDTTLSKALLKKMIDYGYIDSRFVKGKGYIDICSRSTAAPSEAAAPAPRETAAERHRVPSAESERPPSAAPAEPRPLEGLVLDDALLRLRLGRARLRDEPRHRQRLLRVDVHRRVLLERARLEPGRERHGKVLQTLLIPSVTYIVVDRPEDLVHLSDLLLVGEEYAPVEVGHAGFQRALDDQLLLAVVDHRSCLCDA
ncbi:HORMA domain protein, putative [Babesia caballi]|uniref:HORMA domain protein, putative n=1 Tax=Babesia caballi TaxID=5871 RepID=A0AAV4LY38_BABCB|nr:HORMA domain protein, putative [Babesia caballi]